MDINDKLLYEIYFRYENLSAEEGDFYLDVIRHSKEVLSSEYGFRPNYDIVEMLIGNDENGIRFNGSISNGLENRFISGNICNRLNKTYLSMDVERLLGEIPNREYSVVEVFKFNNEYRMQIILKYKSCDNLKKYLKELDNLFIMNKDIRLEIDFNPVNI